MSRADDCTDPIFLGPSEASRTAFVAAVTAAAEAVCAAWQQREVPTSGASYPPLRRALASIEVCPREGVGLSAALEEVARLVLPGAVAVGHPKYAAHLHSVPAIAALAAEVIISATNQSLDSFDQAPSATAVERQVIEWLLATVGFGDAGDGVFTGGATKSNLMGLLLARDHHAKVHLGHDGQANGLPPGHGRFRILCSELAHFSVERAAATLGLGEQAVVRLPADRKGELRPETLRLSIEHELREGRQPIAVVLTAGTTDLGSVDPLAENIDLAASHGLWAHVDAASGGAYLLCESLRPLLGGIERADSVAIDFHKLLFQPISCGVFLVRQAERLALLRRSISYLDPNDGELQSGPNLVAKSLDTTRRFDALKALVTLRALGGRRIGELLQTSLAVTLAAADRVERSPSLELLAPPRTHILLLRWNPAEHGLAVAVVDAVNRRLPHRLWLRGGPVVGGTVYHGRPCLKLTLTSPLCGPSDMDEMLDAIAEAGERQRREVVANRIAKRKQAGALQVARVRSTDAGFPAALSDEFQVFGVSNQYASVADIAAGRMLWYAPYDAASEFYVARDAQGQLAAIVRLIRHDPGAGLRSFSTLVDASAYAVHGEPARAYLDRAWEERFRNLAPASIAELATQAVAKPYRRFGAIDVLWHLMYDVCRAEGVTWWTMALVVPLFKFYKSMFPSALNAIGAVMPDYIGADSVPAALELTHPEVERYLFSSPANPMEAFDDSYL